MTADKNKGIKSIRYNHLNLPTRVSFDTGSSIDYTYDATGVKQSKQVTASGVSSFTFYAGNFIYEQNTAGQKLVFFSHPEGYVEKNGNVFNYVYQYKDHLEDGALRKCPVDIFSERDSMPRWPRLSYKNTSTTGVNLAIVEENNYYPFGLKHKGYNNQIAGRDHNNGFGNKEEQNELGLDWIDITARNYDPALGRWMNLDPLAEKYYSISTYSFTASNPIRLVDENGMEIGDGRAFFDNYRKAINDKISSIQNTIADRNSNQNERINGLREKGKNAKADRIVAKLEKNNQADNNEIGFLQEIGTELDALENSSEVYNLILGNGGSGEGGLTQYNTTSNQIDVFIGDNSLAVISHELTHAYQYGSQQLSFGSNGNGGLMYDGTDELNAYKRSNYFNYPVKYTSLSKVTKAYGIQTGPVNINSNASLITTMTMGTSMMITTFRQARNGVAPFQFYKGWKDAYDPGTLSLFLF